MEGTTDGFAVLSGWTVEPVSGTTMGLADGS